MTQYYKNLDHIKESMKIISNEIKTNGIFKELNPVVFTFTGSGNVSKGAQEIFKMLPHEWIDAKDLKEFCGKANNEIFKNDRVYGCVVEAKDYIKLKSDDERSIFDYNEYLNNPHLYESIFHETIAPYSTVIINGIYWERKYPRLITKEQMKELQLNSQSKLISIADITCDLEGSIEFMKKASTVDDPFYYYDAINDFYSNSQDAIGLQIMSIDNLPTQLPEDSSIHFGKQLEPLIPALVKNFFLFG